MGGKKKYSKKQDNNTSCYNDNNIEDRSFSEVATQVMEPRLKQSHSKIEIIDLETMTFEKTQEVKFAYTFNEYLRFMLVKILPAKDLKIDIKARMLSGSSKLVNNLMNQIKNELEVFCMKVITLKEESDVDVLEFTIEEKFNIKLFRNKYIQKITDDVMKQYGFEQEGKVFLQRIAKRGSETIIMIKMMKRESEDCVQQISAFVEKNSRNSLLNASRIMDREANSKSTISQKQSPATSRVVEREATYPTEKMIEKNNQSQSRITNSSKNKSSSIDEDQEQENNSYYLLMEKTQKSKQKAKKETKSAVNVNLVSNKQLGQPFDDDSVSIVNEKHQFQRKEVQYSQRLPKKEENNQRPKQITMKKPQTEKMLPKIVYKTVRSYEYEVACFNIQEFKAWLKKQKKLATDQVIIKEERDPYNENELIHYTIVLQTEEGSNVPDSDKINALQVFLKYKKVITLNLKNDKYKQMLFQKYQRDDQAIRVEVVKGFKQAKWPAGTMWRHIKQKTYSETKKAANNQYFQAFYLEGLKNQVEALYAEITDKIAKQPVSDEVQEIFLKLDDLADYLRSNDQVKKLVRQYIQKIIPEYFSNICEIADVQFIATGIKINLNVKFDQQSTYHKGTKDMIVKRVTEGLIVAKHEVSFKIDKLIYEKLEKTILVLEKYERSFTFLTTNLKIGQVYNNINTIMSRENIVSEIERIIVDQLAGKKIKQFIDNILKQPEYAQIKYNSSIENNKYTFKFYGREYILYQIGNRIDDFRTQMGDKIIHYNHIIKQKEKDIFKNTEFSDKIHSKYGVMLKVFNGQLDAKIIIQNSIPNFKTKTISIKQCNSLDYSQPGSIIVFRSMKELDSRKDYFLKTFKNYLRKHNSATIFNETTRNYGLMLRQNQKLETILQQALEYRLNTRIIMIMPAHDKQLFIKSLIACLIEEKALLDKEINIFIADFDSQVNMQKQIAIQPYSKGKKIKKQDQVIAKYYIEDKSNKFYYSTNGNDKIVTAKRIGQKKVILNNQDLKIGHISHKYQLSTNTIIHLQSTKSFPVKVTGTQVQFVLKNINFEMPASQAALVLTCIAKKSPQIDLSLGAYEINLQTMKQSNLFSDFERTVLEQKTIIKVDPFLDKVKAFYNISISEINYQYSIDEQAHLLEDIIKEVNDHILSQYKTKQFSLQEIKDFGKDDQQRLRESIVDDDQMVEFNYDRKKNSVVIRSLDANDFVKSEFLIKILQSQQNKKVQVKYPNTWQPQKDEIQTFQVDQKSIQFAQIQAKFTKSKISKLLRIQNKIIYKKYYEEGNSLKSFNNGDPVKTSLLFHGTRATNPEQIYRDKEESFNINYSSDNNLLGKGIYFAERSQYSHDYKYTEKSGMFMRETSMMFLCEVYVGQSQKCLQHDGSIKDTTYRDTVNKTRYQSMTDFLNNSNIYVVYKSRRAYPLYLIRY